MKIQYCSDLHLEFPKNKLFLKHNPLKVEGDILILAGDILLFKDINEYKYFFDFLSESFKYTYWVPGNHEYYYSDISERSNSFSEQIRDNVFLVNNVSVIHDDTKFIFSTLWSKISLQNEWQIQKGLTDFRVIKKDSSIFTPYDYNVLHQNSIVFIEKELLSQNKQDKTVVVTHHVPTYMNYPEQYKGSALNEAFATELFDLIERSNINYWIFGHSHENISDFNIGKTKLLTNQMGYVNYGENKNFDTGRHFEI